MKVTVFATMFLVSCLLEGCNVVGGQTSPSGSQNASPEEQSTMLNAVSVDEAEKFVNSWCGSGVLTNLRKLDADKHLISADMPSWLNVEKNKQEVKDHEGSQAELISDLKVVPSFKALFPTGKMILADFSSGSGCRNTLVAIDTLAVAYLKKLKDSANAITCKRESQGGYHALKLSVPSVAAIFGSDDPLGEGGCDSTLATVLVGHASSGTLVLSHVSNGDTRVQEPPLFAFLLSSFMLEADGSAQFLRSDGAVKFIFSDFR